MLFYFPLLDTYSKHELTKSLSLFLYILNREYTVYTSCVLNQPNNHVCVVFKSLCTPTFHAVVQLLNQAEFNLHVLDPKRTAVCLK